MSSRWRSPDDREILHLAAPALGALAAGPLYVLVDTAIVGHLGTVQLAALALAATIVSTVTQLSDFLSYGTTAHVARLRGAGHETEAGGVGAQALWLSLGTGLVVALLLVVAATPLADALGAHASVNHAAARYMRLVAIGLPGMLIALAGEGVLRGLGDLRTPLRILVAANAANVVLEIGLVYGLHLGLEGSALGTAIAQVAMGLLFARWMLHVAPPGTRRPALRRIRPLLRLGAELTVRSAALLGAFLLATALAARIGTAALVAHQIAFELFLFLALVLDAIAIAGQIMVARRLGAGDAAGARRAALRMIGWALLAGTIFGVVLIAGIDLIPRAFSGDHRVWREARQAWPWFALMQPVAGVVFALDGILIGAGDTRYLAGAMVLSLAAFVGPALAAHSLQALWIALDALMVVRLVTLGVRFARGRWLVTGAGVTAIG
jgi:putative MATE family efflux protein